MNTTPSSSDSGKLRLVVQFGEEVPSFKNSKMIITRPRPRLITKPERQKWMQKAILVIESQLRSWLLTTGTETQTGLIPLSKIASSLPLDDSLKWIPSHSVSWRRVKKGEEGAIIEIERLT